MEGAKKNGISQRLGRRRGDGDRSRRRASDCAARNRSPFRTRASRAPLALTFAAMSSSKAERPPTSSRLPPISLAPSSRFSCRPPTCRCRRRSIRTMSMPAQARHVQPRGRGAAVAGLFAQSRDRQGRRDRSGHVQGHRQPGRHAEPGAYRSVLGSADAVGFGGRERARRPRRRRADRSKDRQGRQSGRRARFLQHLFHARRQIGDRRRRGDAAARVPRSPHDGAAGLHLRRPNARGSITPIFRPTAPTRSSPANSTIPSPRSISSTTSSSRRCR